MTGRRVVFTAPRTAVWEEYPIPTPAALGPREALVRATVSLVSAGTEIALYTGTHIGFSIPTARWPRYPLTSGYALAGEVLAVGAAVTEVAPGDRVAGYGVHGTHDVCDLDHTRLFHIPSGVSDEQAVLARLADIAMHGVRRGGVALGDRVAVFGQGLIGQFALQLVRLAGARLVLGVDVLDARLAVSRALGAAHTLNPQREDLQVATAALTGGAGFTVAIEATGNPGVIPTALEVVGELGRVVLLGAPRGRVELDPYTHIFHKGVALIGCREHTAPLTATPYNPWTRANNYLLCLDLVAQGALRTDGLISHRVPQAEALTAFDALADHPADYLGVILDWT